MAFDCDGNPLERGTLFVGPRQILTIENGIVDGDVTLCDKENISLIGYDESFTFASGEISIPFANEVNLDDIFLCQTGESIDLNNTLLLGVNVTSDNRSFDFVFREFDQNFCIEQAGANGDRENTIVFYNRSGGDGFIRLSLPNGCDSPPEEIEYKSFSVGGLFIDQDLVTLFDRSIESDFEGVSIDGNITSYGVESGDVISGQFTIDAENVLLIPANVMDRFGTFEVNVRFSYTIE